MYYTYLYHVFHFILHYTYIIYVYVCMYTLNLGTIFKTSPSMGYRKQKSNVKTVLTLFKLLITGVP